MPKSKARKNVDENFKVAAVQRLQTGGVPANDLAKELGVSIWSLRRWSRQYRKRTAAGEGVAGEPATFATASQELPAKASSEPPVIDGGLIDAIARIELEISSLDKQAAGAKNGGRDLETTFGRQAGIVPRLATSGGVMLLGLESCGQLGLRPFTDGNDWWVVQRRRLAPDYVLSSLQVPVKAKHEKDKCHCNTAKWA